MLIVLRPMLCLWLVLVPLGVLEDTFGEILALPRVVDGMVDRRDKDIGQSSLQ